MCGIIGIVGKSPVTDRIIESLKRLEYRGYDSAGVAIQTNGRSTAAAPRARSARWRWCWPSSR